METRMNAVTTEGEKVVIVSKEITDGARPYESQILKSEDGRTFKPAGGGQVMEVSIMDAGEADLDEAPATEAAVEEIPEPDSEQAAEAPAEDGEEEADS